jgi:chromosome partitioning protein
MKTIALVNQKGGVGKTATTANLGIGLSRHGKRVALLDFDPQGSLTDSLGWKRPDDLNPTIANLMEKIIDETPIAEGEGILHHAEGVDLIPANIELAGMDVALVNTMSRETILRSYLQEVRGKYDILLIDCAPTLGSMGLGITNAIALDGGGSFILKNNWTEVAGTAEDRRINTLGVYGLFL